MALTCDPIKYIYVRIYLYWNYKTLEAGDINNKLYRKLSNINDVTTDTYFIVVEHVTSGTR